MLYTGLFKRIVPFVLTFAAGLLFAGIFVPVGLPNVDSWADSGPSRGHCHRKKHLWLEKDNFELKEKMRELRIENDELRRNIPEPEDLMRDAVPPVDLDEHHPPAPPKKPKRPDRQDTFR